MCKNDEMTMNVSNFKQSIDILYNVFKILLFYKIPNQSNMTKNNVKFKIKNKFNKKLTNIKTILNKIKI